MIKQRFLVFSILIYGALGSVAMATEKHSEAATSGTSQPAAAPTDWRVALVGLAWPIVALLAALLFRSPLGEFLRAIGGRATKLSVGQVALELSPASEFQPPPTTAAEIRQATPVQMGGDSSSSLFKSLQETEYGDYVTIDLGSVAEPRWLTSRLFILATMLERMRGVRWIVFTERTPLETSSFVGYASTTAIRWRLAQNYTWFEQAFADAYWTAIQAVQLYDPGNNAPCTFAVTSASGQIPTPYASAVVLNFLRSLERMVPPTENAAQWVTLHEDKQPVYERARWVTREVLALNVDGSLIRSSISGAPSVTPSQAAEQIVACTGPFVARVAENNRLIDLVDRNDLLEKVAKQALPVSGC